MDTNKMREISREQFEDWADKNWPGAKRQQLERDEFGNYKNSIYRDFWTGWQASREAVVVELPSACAYEGLTEHLGSVIELSYEAPEHDPVGLARLPDVRAAIEAQGLKVAP